MSYNNIFPPINDFTKWAKENQGFERGGMPLTLSYKTVSLSMAECVGVKGQCHLCQTARKYGLNRLDNCKMPYSVAQFIEKRRALKDASTKSALD